jgi:hypothetical protein
MSRFTAARALAVGVVAAALAVSGCSSKKAAGSGGATTSTPPASAPGPSTGGAASPAASISGDPAAVKLYTEALAGLTSAKSVHIKGSSTQDGDTFGIDLTFSNGKGVTGSLGLGGGTMQVVAVNGTVYVNLDAKAFAAFAGSDVPAAAASAVAGKWLSYGAADEDSSDNPFSGLGELTDIKQFAQDFAPAGSVTEDPVKKTINGQSAIALLDDGGDDPTNDGIFYVQAGGAHLPLEIVPGPSASAGTASVAPATGKIDFLDYDKDVTLAAPTGAIDVSQLAALMGLPSASAS